MTGFLALIGRDLKLATRVGSDALTLVLFFVMVGVIVPFAIGPDSATLSRLAPGIIWIAAFLSMLLGLDRLFRADDEDGSLLLFRHAGLPLEMIVVAKVIAHWLLTALPLIVASPVLAILLAMDFPAWEKTVVSLLLGTPGLVALGTIGAAVTVSLKRGGLIAPVLIMPLSIPILIFGTGAIAEASPEGLSKAALLFLAAISLVTLVLAPFAAALALRLAED
ncbi:MAG TPA: heme exporter protein CcmB [Devosiaceae bacterium]|nr:heme exporter protein CcmB [Devosiaceae bacterium]